MSNSYDVKYDSIGYRTELPYQESPVPSTLGEFVFKHPLNTFYPLGLAEKGRYHVAFFFKQPLGPNVYVQDDKPFTYTTHCLEHTIVDKGGTIIGALFSTDRSRTKLGNYKLYVGTPKIQDTMAGFPIISDNWGTHAYWSDNGVLIIPTTIKSQFIITDARD
jgi:hypothetical protein